MRAILGACALCCGIFSMPEADASVLINIDLSSQTMHVSSDMGSYDCGFPPHVQATGRRAGLTGPISCSARIIRTNIICRRCLIPSFSPVAMRFTALIRRHRLAAPPRTDVFASRRAMPRSCSTWCKPRAPGSPSPGRCRTRAIMPMSCGAGDIIMPSPMCRRGMRQPCEPGRSIPSSNRCRNGRFGPELIYGRPMAGLFWSRTMKRMLSYSRLAQNAP